jgi:hypothetical protein
VGYGRQKQKRLHLLKLDTFHHFLFTYIGLIYCFCILDLFYLVEGMSGKESDEVNSGLDTSGLPLPPLIGKTGDHGEKNYSNIVFVAPDEGK